MLVIGSKTPVTPLVYVQQHISEQSRRDGQGRSKEATMQPDKQMASGVSPPQGVIVMLVYHYIPIFVRLVVSLRGRDRHADGCNEYPGDAVYSHYSVVASLVRARCMAQPDGRCVPALVVCLYPAMSGIAQTMSLIASPTALTAWV